jgi:hypothetical protein
LLIAVGDVAHEAVVGVAGRVFATPQGAGAVDFAAVPASAIGGEGRLWWRV